MQILESLYPIALLPYINNDYQLIPLFNWDHITVENNDKILKDGKRPINKDWTNRPYNNNDQVEYMKKGGNVGVRLTETQLVIDIDPRNMPPNRNTFIELCKAAGIVLDNYPQVVTGSGGLHVYMTKPAGVNILDSLEGYAGVEFKSKGRQVVAAGSKHPSGNIYTWEALSRDLSETPIIPDRLLSLIRRPNRSAGYNAEGGEYSQSEIANMLMALTPEKFRHHEDWFALMQACHHASNGEARSEFIAWSIQDTQYAKDIWIIGRRWDSLHIQNPGKQMVTYRTLHKYLRDFNQDDAIISTISEEEFIDDIPLPRDSSVLAPTHERKGPLTQLNDTYCAVNDGGKFRVYYEIYDPSEKRKKWQNMDKTNFEAYLAHKTIKKANTAKNKSSEYTEKPIAGEWLCWKNRHTAQGVVFDPEQNYPGFLNLWTGWAITPIPGDWSLMQELITGALCDNDPKASDFVLNWIAYMVQKPWEPAEVAIAFHGKKGTGKSTLGRILAALAGRHSRHITSSEHITGRFNAHLMDIVFLFADEAIRPTDKEAQNRLKAMITEETLQFEAKGKDLRTGMNRLHIMMASNDDWFVPMGMVDGERRYFVARVNDDKYKDYTFFAKLKQQMYNEQGLEAMLHDLQLRDITNWAPRGNVPNTAAVIEQKLRNMPILAQWWFNQLEKGYTDFPLSRDKDNWHISAIRAFYQDVKLSFERFCQEAKVKPFSMNKGIDRYFATEILKICPEVIKDNRDAIPNDRPDIQPAGTSGRARSFEFPCLVACRKCFETAIEGSVDWPATLQ